MSIRIEQYRALAKTRAFLAALLDPRLTPKVPGPMRDRAMSCLRHFPILRASGEPMWSRDDIKPEPDAPVDLRTCKPGDLLEMRNGCVVTYAEPIPGNRPYNHKVIHKAGFLGTRTDDGRFCHVGEPHRNDIIRILPRKEAT